MKTTRDALRENRKRCQDALLRAELIASLVDRTKRPHEAHVETSMQEDVIEWLRLLGYRARVGMHSRIVTEPRESILSALRGKQVSSGTLDEQKQ